MAFAMNAISIIFLSFMGVVRSQVKVEKDDNIEPFALLCRIYNVAKNPPINYVDSEEPFEIVRDIDGLNMSLLEDERLNEKENSGNNSEAQVKPTLAREAALAQLSLNQITQKAHNILEEIKKVNVTENIGKAKAELNKVIFGENGNESDLCLATVNGIGRRAEACGKPGAEEKGSHAGKNLVVDFFCLCAQRTENKEGVNQVCGFYVGRLDKHYGWGETDPWGSSTMWASIKGGCGKHMQQHPKSTAEARHILYQFLKHLKTGGVYRWGDDSNVKGSNQKEGMLGTAVGKKDSNGSGVFCDGKEGGKNQVPGGICVYYGQESNSWETSIPWLKPFKTALSIVDAANNQTASIQRAIAKLQTLLHRAEEIYETTKVITEIQSPVLLVAFRNASGNMTAYNATRTRSYGYISHPYFILAWALLLL